MQRNKPGKIIILYDEDERIAPSSATIFVQREVDNVFMLSGGKGDFNWEEYFILSVNERLKKVRISYS